MKDIDWKIYESIRDMKIIRGIYDAILACPPVPPETGVILGERRGVICEYHRDSGAAESRFAQYTPNIEMINKQIWNWDISGITFCGIAHTHPYGQVTLSSGDVEYISKIMVSLPPIIKSLYFPIIQPSVSLYSYIAVRNGTIVEVKADSIEIL